MFGLSREVDFAVRLGLIAEEQGKAMLESLNVSYLHFMKHLQTNNNNGFNKGLKLKSLSFLCIIKQEESMYIWNTTIIKSMEINGLFIITSSCYLMCAGSYNGI